MRAKAVGQAFLASGFGFSRRPVVATQVEAGRGTGSTAFPSSSGCRGAAAFDRVPPPASCPSGSRPHPPTMMKRHATGPFVFALLAAQAAGQQTVPVPSEAPAPFDFGAPVEQTSDLVPLDEVAPERLTPTRPQAPHAELHFDAHGGEHWVRGRTYKASVSAQGFTYYPYLGVEAERSYPLGFRLARVTEGGREVAVRSNGHAARVGERFSIDRGVVDAHYELALEGVEQLFTIEPGVASGELVLELALDTDLVAESMGAGFRFSGPEGGVDYGAAIAFDESGMRTDVSSAIDGDVLRLTVPAGFVDSARGAITIDPVVTTFSVNDNTTFSYFEPDVTYDRTNNVFVYVYEEFFSGTDYDLFYTRTDSNGGVLSNGYVLISSREARSPEAANLAVSDQCLVVFTRAYPQGGTEIVGRFYDANLDSNGLIVTIAQPTDPAFELSSPDVGGGAVDNPSSLFMVAWSEEQADGDVDVNFRSVAQDGTLGTNFRAEVTTNKIKDEVVVGASIGTDGATGSWPIVYREEDRTTGNVVLKGLRMRPNGINSLGASQELFRPTAGNDLHSIDVSSTLSIGSVAPTYLVAYEIDNGTDEEIFLLVCREDERRSRIELALIEHGPRERNHLLPRLSTTREDFVVTYLEQRPGTLITDPYLTVVDLIEDDFLAVSEQRTRLGDGGPLFSGGAAMASRFDSGLTTSRVNGVAWARFETINGNSSWNVRGVRHSGFNPAVAGPQYCFGNPNSTGERGFLMVQGNATTTDAKTLVAMRLPPNQFGLFASATLPAFQPVVPNSSGALCIGGAIGRFNAQIAQADANGELSVTIDPTQLPTPFGFESAMAGSFRQFQLWHRDVDGGGATSNFTNGVSIFFR